MFLFLLINLIFILILIKVFYKNFYLLAGCKYIRIIGQQNNLEKFLYVIPGTTIFGNNFDFKETTTYGNFKIHRELVKKSQYKNYVRYFIKKPCVNIVNPEEAELILNNKKLVNKSVTYKILHPFLNEGLLTSGGKKWFERRKLIIPTLNFSNLKNKILEIFKKQTTYLLEKLKTDIDEDTKIVSLSDLLTKFSLNCVSESAFGLAFGNTEDSVKYLENVHQHEQDIIYDIFSGVTYFSMISKLKNWYVKNSRIVKNLHNITKKIIEERRNYLKNEYNFELSEFKKYSSLLDILLITEAKGMIDKQGVQEEVDTFMYAAYDTTSGALMFTLLLLSHSQDVQQKCLEEILNITDDPSNLTINDCSNLKYLECVIKETLRLYPSAPSLGRECVKDTILGNLLLPKGTIIHIELYDIHRNPRHYNDPNKFNPDRFLPENSINRHPYAFIPFSAGMRSCIGHKYAFLQMKVMLANFLKEFKVLPVTKMDDIVLGSGILLKPKDSIKIKIVKRKI